MRAGRGFSLIELLIASALLGLFMTSVVAALVYCNRYLQSAESKIAAQTACLQASTWISRTLSEGTMTSVQAVPGVGVSFASPRTPGSGEVTFLQGQLVWKQAMVYYLTNNSLGEPILEHKAFPYSGPPRLDPLPPFPVMAAAAAASDHRRVIARYVRRFEVDIYDVDPIYSPDLQGCARIMIETFVPHYGLDYGVTVRTQVKLEN